MNGWNIMLIDDDEVFGFIFEEIIENSGLDLKLHIFKNGKDALNYFKEAGSKDSIEGIPELVFLDINMPGINGWDFLEEYRRLGIAEKKHSVFTMLSSSVFDSDKSKARQYEEVSGFIVKPLTIDDVKRIAETYLVKRNQD